MTMAHPHDTPLILPLALAARISEHLRAAYPNEGGGLLLGALRDGLRVAEDVAPVENTFPTEEQFHRYGLPPQTWARLEDEADARGLAVIGFYHSHPDHPAEPSSYDLAHAWPHLAYLIVSIANGEVADMRAWLLRDNRSGFDALPLREGPLA